MDIKNRLFAKEDLTYSVRLITALKIVAKKFCCKNFNAPAVLFTLIHDWENDLLGDQRAVVGDIAFGRERSHEIKEMFVKMYYDDDVLLDYLNKKISDRYFVRAKMRKTTESEVNASVKVIINDGFLSTFLNG